MFTEEHLQGFWYKQAAGLKGLTTFCKQSVQLIDTGEFNHHQGPDFLNSRIRIGEVEWVGHVEIHLRTSDWLRHLHQNDTNYDNVILHVVWVHDTMHFTQSPVLELSKFFKIQQLDTPELVTDRYYFSCNARPKFLITVSEEDTLRQLAFKRIFYRKAAVLKLFHSHKLDYARVLWRLIFRCFGRVTNADAFEELYQSIPIHIFRLYAYDQLKMEALLMGQANLLHHHYKDEYAVFLYQQYIVLKQRHGLNPIKEKMKWLRMRPRNFPTIRVAQLATFYHQHFSLVRDLLELNDLKMASKLFDIQIHSYWNNHYYFDRKSIVQDKIIGQGLRQQIILHAFVPFLMAYGSLHNQNRYENLAMNWMCELNAEQNSLMEAFSSLGFKTSSIFDTQALHELYLQHCLQSKCSACVRGIRCSLE